MYVVTFYWEGDRWRRKGSSKRRFSGTNHHETHLRRAGVLDRDIPTRYVNNLFRGVTRNAGSPFRFVLFTNEELDGLDKGVEVRPFYPPTTMGVLPRLWMFCGEAGLLGHQVLALDLDIIITGKLKDIMAYDGRFCARSKFKPGEEYKLDGDIISFRADEENEDRFWKQFIERKKEAERTSKGRERYWFRFVTNNKADRWDQYAPNQIVSYKRHVARQDAIPKGARIVSCHGVPRPHQITKSYLRKYWR